MGFRVGQQNAKQNAKTFMTGSANPSAGASESAIASTVEKEMVQVPARKKNEEME